MVKKIGKKVSSGKSKEVNKRKEEKRQLKFQKRKEEGKVYEYEPNRYTPGTLSYAIEQNDRKRKNHKKLPYAAFVSRMRKVQNELEKERESAKKAK